MFVLSYIFKTNSSNKPTPQLSCLEATILLNNVSSECLKYSSGSYFLKPLWMTSCEKLFQGSVEKNGYSIKLFYTAYGSFLRALNLLECSF